MVRKLLAFVLLTVLWCLPFPQFIEAGYDYELGSYDGRASEHRDAANVDDLIERGQASVTDSPQFPDGIRLTAWAKEEGEFEPGLASAIYYFSVPSWTHYVKIRVWYRDLSRDDNIAGRLWIKTADGDSGRALGSDDEAPFRGDTFVLRYDRTSETVYVPAARHVEDGTVEMHVVASRRDSLDVKYILVEYLKKKPTRIKVVHHYYGDYWYRWPPYRYSYHYYYWGPYYWPKTSLIYVHWVWPDAYYWHRYRPWYRAHIVTYYHRHPKRYYHRHPKRYYGRHPHRYRRYRRPYRHHPEKRIVPRRRHPERRTHIARRGARIAKRGKESLPNADANVKRGPEVRRSTRSGPRRQTAEKQIRRGRRARLPRTRIRGEIHKRPRLRSAPRRTRSRSAYRGRSPARSRTRGIGDRPMKPRNGRRGGGQRRMGMSRRGPRR